MGKLEGKISLVTGGNSGIGLATVKQFVTEGAYVFLTGRRKPEWAAAVKEIGRSVLGWRIDSLFALMACGLASYGVVMVAVLRRELGLRPERS